MPIDISREADLCISAASGDVQARRTIGVNPREDDLSGSGYRIISSSEITKVLKAEQRKFFEEDYQKLDKTLAADSRLKPYLPGLAIDSLLDGSIRYDRKSEFSFSKDTIKAASENEAMFDEVHRRSLKYAYDNFDKFLLAAPDDLKNKSESTNEDPANKNSSDITKADLIVVGNQVRSMSTAEASIKSIGTILANFDAIDLNKSGKITYKEGRAWFDKNYPGAYLYSPYENLSSQLPKMNYQKYLNSSEELSKADLKERANKLSNDLAKFRKDWNLD